MRFDHLLSLEAKAHDIFHSDYLYAGVVPTGTETEVGELVETLRLAHYFDLKDLYTVVETNLINKCMTPWTYSQCAYVFAVTRSLCNPFISARRCKSS